jgi:ATP-dependent RNA helicase DeaD
VYYEVRNNMKMEVLSRIIDMYNLKSMIVFCNTKRMVDELVTNLQARGYFADGLHGDMNQTQRTNVMAKFKAGTLEILVATDVAARGIDVEDLEAVFNYDLPQDEEAYVHRIGRTGRAGKSGRAFSFVSGRDIYKLKDIMRFTNAKIKLAAVPSYEDVAEIKTNLFLDQIKEVIQQGKLEKQVARIERLLTEDFTSLEIAAALLKMNLKEAKAQAASEEMKGPREGFNRLFVTIGKKDRIHPKDIIEALTENTSIPSSKIGDIDLYDKFSFVEIAKEYTSEVLDRLGRTTLLGKPVSFEKAQSKMPGEKEREGSGGGNRGNFEDRPRRSGGGDRDRNDRERNTRFGKREKTTRRW